MNHHPLPTDRSVTAALLRRHDQPGPRHTSYPTAIEFSDRVDRESYEACLNAANRLPDEVLAANMHLPFCEGRSHFSGGSSQTF
ncbi:MAG: oxygen-independent coproporphyrinogen-3 oxidase [Candidatus Paceibacteria bacterium]|jgi:oxygen-independent coproporphyrinogen-3 oxidase